MHLDKQQKKIQAINNRILAAKKIIAAVRAQIQEFASRVYHERLFSRQAKTIFEQYQEHVDVVLAATAKSAFTKLPAAFERLGDDDEESISHALTTCRRVITSFADSVFPPRDEPFQLGSQSMAVGEAQTLNRLRAYIYERIGQSARYNRLSRSLSDLYDRVSAGVHGDVTAEEARALLLATYMLLGELLTLPAPTAGDSHS